MKTYRIKVRAYHKYWFDREYTIQASNEATAVARAIRKFWSEKTNKKRKRKTTEMIINLIK